MARGGYRKPSNPAPVSGPGSLSRRTDGGPTQGAKYIRGNTYGESKALMEAQQAAPMAAAPAPSASVTRPQVRPMQPITELTAPTERPDEPFSTGMPFDPTTPGPEILGVRNQQATLSSTLMQIAPFDETGEITELANYLVIRGL